MSRQTCTRCYKIPIDILILECDHSLCIKCATQICQLSTSCIKCPRCKYSTYLDEQIINQIEQFSVQFQEEQIRGNSHGQKNKQDRQNAEYINGYNSSSLKQTMPKNKSKSNKDKKLVDYLPCFNGHQTNTKSKNQQKNRMAKQETLEFNSQDDTTDIFDFNKSLQKKNSKKFKNQKIMAKDQRVNTQSEIFCCKEHRQYELMYVCLECDNVFICPECIIHGVHKNHQVETIKKMINKIHAQLSSKIYSLDCSIEGLIQASEDRKHKLKDKIDQIGKLKQQTILKYKSIRQQLARQQAEIIQNCHYLMQEFEKDFSQTQMWIKNDLITIEKEKDSINYILNPSNTLSDSSTLKKLPKLEQKITEMKIVQQYFSHLRRNEKGNKKNYLWLNKKQNEIQFFQTKSQENLEMLTDRIQKIKLALTLPNNKPQTNHGYMNNLATKHPSLAVSRSRQSNHSMINYNASSILENKQASKVMQSPFNMLRASHEKENLIPETESILVNGSRNNHESRRIKKKALKSQQQNNYLVF